MAYRVAHRPAHFHDDVASSFDSESLLALTGSGIRGVPSTPRSHSAVVAGAPTIGLLLTASHSRSQAFDDAPDEPTSGFRYDIRSATAMSNSSSQQRGLLLPVLSGDGRGRDAPTSGRTWSSGSRCSLYPAALSCNGRSIFDVKDAAGARSNVSSASPSRRQRRRPETSSSLVGGGGQPETATCSGNAKLRSREIEAVARRHIWSCHVPGSVKRSSRVVSNVGELYGSLMSTSSAKQSPACGLDVACRNSTRAASRRQRLVRGGGGSGSLQHLQATSASLDALASISVSGIAAKSGGGGIATALQEPSDVGHRRSAGGPLPARFRPPTVGGSSATPRLAWTEQKRRDEDGSTAEQRDGRPVISLTVMTLKDQRVVVRHAGHASPNFM